MCDCIITDSDEHKALCSGNSVTSDALLSPAPTHDVNFWAPQMSDIYACHLGWMSKLFQCLRLMQTLQMMMFPSQLLSMCVSQLKLKKKKEKNIEMRKAG